MDTWNVQTIIKKLKLEKVKMKVIRNVINELGTTNLLCPDKEHESARDGLYINITHG